MTLLEDALDASGGMDRWHQIERFTVHLSMDGALLARKGKAGLLKNLVAEGCTRTQSLRLTGFTAPDKCCVYRPDQVTIEGLDGDVLQARSNPGAAFLGHTDHTPWDDLHLAYFCGFSIWNYLTTPFLLAHPDIKLEELPSREEGGEAWRRLRAVFPALIATHSPEQIFYFDHEGLQRRLDYCTDGDRGDAHIAHYSTAHQEFSGIVVPTLHRSLKFGPDGTVIHRPASVDIEIFDASFE
jgi:hypothetical protein